MEVELDAFSGRPNPRWTLSPAKSSEMVTKIASLREPADAPNPPDLGFRGFVLRSGDRAIRVFGGRIVVTEQGRAGVYRDTAGIEGELTEQARERGFGPVVGER